jgi:predicted CXXCH cytochrome family protein
MKDDPCKKFSHYDKDGNPVYVEKRSYDTDKEAIEIARQMNTNEIQIHKAIAYKCLKCHKWHVGRTSKILTEKDKKRYASKKPF